MSFAAGNIFENPGSHDNSPFFGPPHMHGHRQHQPHHDNKTLKFYAFYFPQFYPAPENGGLNDWRYFQNQNFTRNGRNEPILRPKNHVYYDPRRYETRLTQRNLAVEYGIDGFIFYDYYFTYPILPDVVEMMLQDGEPKIEFAFLWVNEGFQGHGPIYKDPLRHALWVARFFRHPLYIHLKGRPVYYIYHTRVIPQDYLTEFKQHIVSLNLPEPYIIQCMQNHGNNMPQLSYVDGYTEFAPNLPGREIDRFKSREKTTQLGLLVNFDNTPRSTRGVVNTLDKLPPLLPTKNRSITYGRNKPFLKRVCEDKVSAFYQNTTSEKWVNIFAWNEWSEQASIEPSDHFNYDIAEAILECKQTVQARFGLTRHG